MKDCIATESYVDGVHRAAVISACGKFRYLLTRHWGPAKSGHVLAVCGANPSDADGLIDDPTMVRVQNFVRGYGFHGVVMINTAAYRSPYPEAVPRCWRGLGPYNQEALHAVASEVSEVVCAWGTAGHRSGTELALGIFREHFCRLLCWGTTKAGHPRHPLYLRADTPLVPFEPCLT